MCLIAMLWRCVDDAPLIVAANREEAYDRPATPPQLVADSGRFVAGIDRLANGTWLGVNQCGIMIAVTNLDKHDKPAHPRSRGLLARQLLAARSAQEAVEWAVREVRSQAYDGCNLVIADGRDLIAVQAGDWLQVLPLPTGHHVVANRTRPNDEANPRIQFTHAWLAAQPCTTAEQWLQTLPNLCRHAGDRDSPPICVRGRDRGTVSSSIILLQSPVAQSQWHHSQGPPDRTPYQDFSHLLGQL